MDYKLMKRYLLGLLLMVGGILTATAQSSGDGYNPDNPNEPGDPSTLSYYSVTATPNITGAGTLTGTGKFKYNTSTNVKATANSGYKLLRWMKGENQVTTSASFSHNVTEDVEFTAVFEKAKKVTLARNLTAGGTVSGSGSSFYKGQTTTLTATTNTDYKFLGWLKNDETEYYNINKSFVYTIEDDDVKFTAVFEYVAPPYLPENPGEPNEDPTHMVSYNVGVTASPADAGVVTGNGKHKWGTSVMISTSPNAGYEFRRWLKDGVEYSTATSFNYTVTAEDVNFTAEYEWVGIPEPEPTSHKLYLIAAVEGSCTFSMTNGADVKIGSQFTVTATPGTDFTFGGWFLGQSLVSTNPTYTGTMGQENILLTANCIYTPYSPEDPGAVVEDPDYTDKRRTVTILSSNEHFGSVATVNVTAGGVALAGSEVTASATAKENYLFKGWSNGASIVSTDATYTFTVENNTTLIAMFQADLGDKKLGDANVDGDVDVTDITAVVSHIYGNTPENFNVLTADVNGDTDIDVTDITGIVSIIYSGNEARSMGSSSYGQPSLVIPNITIDGEHMELPIYARNLQPYSSIQFDIVLPDGIGIESASFSSAVKDGHNVMADYVNGVYRIMGYSMSNCHFGESSEPVITLMLKIDENVESGKYYIEVQKAVVSAIGEKVRLTTQCGQISVAGETGISTVVAPVNNNNVYNLSGIRINKASKGVYINNGKKYIK